MINDINEETLEFLSSKSTTLSIRLKLSDLKKLLSGEKLIVKIRDRKFEIKKVE